MNLHVKLTNWRKKQKLSLRAAAQRIGCSHTTLDRIEKGRIPSPVVAKQLGKALDFDWRKVYE